MTSAPQQGRTVTLYTKKDCGLCREAERVLGRLHREKPFALVLVDIEADARIYDRYWDRVPVVAVDGKEVAAAPLDETYLRALLSA